MGRPTVSKRVGNYGNDFKVKAVRLTFMKGTKVQDVAKALVFWFSVNWTKGQFKIR